MKSPLTAGEIAKALDRSRRYVNKRAMYEAWPYGVAPGRGYGGQKRLYPIDSLPVDVQAAVIRARESESRTVHDLDLGQVKTSLSVWDRAPESQRKKALAWEEVITRFNEYTRRQNLTQAKERFETEYNAQNIFLPFSTETREIIPHITRSTLDKKRAAYKHGGLPALLDLPNRGKPPNKLTREMQDFIIGLLVQTPHRRASRIHDYGRAKYGKLWPSARTVRRVVKRVKQEKKEVLLYIRNPDKWRSNYQVSHGDASAKAKHYLHVVEFDSTKGEIDFAGKRYNFTFAIDIFSRKAKGLLSPTGTSEALCNLLRLVILDWGIPDLALCDNGSEYVSNHFKVVCEALGTEIIYAQKFTPDDKGFVERVIWSVEMMFFEEMGQYLGHNVAERKEIEARRSFAQRILKKGEVVQCVLSPQEFQATMNAWIEHIYHQRDHRGIGMSPEAKAATSSRPAKNIKDPRVLDILLTPVGERTVQKTGISFENGCYIAPELVDYIGRKVAVRQDCTDVGRLHVFNRKGEFVCIARDKSIEGITPEQARELKKAQKARLREETRALKALAESEGDPMLGLIELKKKAPGQVRALPRQEIVSSESIRQAARAVEEREKLAEDGEEEATQAAVGFDSPLAAFTKIAAQRQQELTEKPLHLFLPDPKPEEE
ncbi:MAG: Mu transposase C-terminal domain-containing protein [Thermodesulfobacteriota bacterium]|nr:Mu transposase C-terminal domain-containing protein [Thermodesulfobacteriota bacterium]